MIHHRGDDGLAPQGRAVSRVDGEERPAAQVLADRVAAALIHHEPGWRLPRRSALARRYGVSPAEMEAAIEELATRHLLRRLPDGQVYRASPADYLISLEGLNLRASIDPMGTIIVCASRHVSVRRVPEDIGGVLGLSPGDPVSVVRCLWTSGGDPAAFSATYLPDGQDLMVDDLPEFADVLKPSLEMHQAQVAPGPPDSTAGPARPGGLYVELQPPAPSVARSLRLAAGQPAVNVTIRFDGPADRPMALATAVLRSDMFRVVVESPQAPRATSFADEDDVVWTHTAEGWEP